MPLLDTHFQDKILALAKKTLTDIGFSPYRADLWDRMLLLLAILLMGFISYLLFCKLFLLLVHMIIKRSKLKLPRILYEKRFFYRVLNLIPPVIVLVLIPLVFGVKYQSQLSLITKIINIYFTFIFARIVTSFLQGVYEYYLMKNELSTSPYKAAVEMSRLFVDTIMILAIIGIITNLKLSNVITGLSAFAAVLVLIFKDTVLGFVAGMQLAKNRMICIGDWIVVPQTPANGTVVEINILTVKVQNFDNTLIYVPSYTLVTNSFQNWRGMVDSGIRRVSKAVLIDVGSIAIADDALRTKVYSDQVIVKYFGYKGISSFDEDKTIDPASLSTNLGLFRQWLYVYLFDNQDVSNEPYLIIRDLPAQGAGLPLDIMFFARTTDWTRYEHIQSQIFEQIMSKLDYFGLKQFQYSSSIVNGIQ